MIVITNSRKFALRKLLAMQVKQPMDHIVFVTESSDLHASASNPIPALTLWQRGRLSEDQKNLRAKAQELFERGSLREASKEEVKNSHVQQSTG